MIVLVCGGRSYPNGKHVFHVLDTLHGLIGIRKIVNGDAGSRNVNVSTSEESKWRGADKQSTAWALSRGIEVTSYPAMWGDLSQADCLLRSNWRGQYDARAGIRRNEAMLRCENIDLVVAFPGHLGTEDMVRRAFAHGIDVYRA